jgi:hypothetical protein
VTSRNDNFVSLGKKYIPCCQINAGICCVRQTTPINALISHHVVVAVESTMWKDLTFKLTYRNSRQIPDIFSTNKQLSKVKTQGTKLNATERGPLILDGLGGLLLWFIW